jgi:CheY-like chemotaxis protein
MDTQMPVMDGLTAIRQIREIEQAAGAARIPIISLTANAMPHQVEACLAAGADLHLAKPITITGLLESLAAAIELVEPSQAATDEQTG